MGKLFACSDTVELWRTLGRGFFAIEKLQLLMGKLKSAEDTPARSNCLDEEGSDNLATLETLMVCEVTGTFLPLFG